MHVAGAIRAIRIDRLIIIYWELILIEQDPNSPTALRTASHRTFFYSLWIVV
jgi:hypothetical protein